MDSAKSQQSLNVKYTAKRTASPLQDPTQVKKAKTEQDSFQLFKEQHKEALEAIRKENSSKMVSDAPKNSFGNYNRYYEMRNLSKWEDMRVKILKQEWITNKKCLDIGCNDGTLTILMAKTFYPSLIIGIDIDSKLIAHAIKSVSKSKQIESNSLSIPIPDTDAKLTLDLLNRIEKLPIVFQKNLNINRAQIDQAKKKCGIVEMEEVKCEAPKRVFPHNIQFRQENYISDLDLTEKYDCILCLSTIKWVHLNYGDVGVQALFHKVYNSLNENGIFIIEPQQHKSYKKRCKLSDRLKKNYKEIKFYPQNFEEYLLKNFRFQLIDKLQITGSANKNFDRPILVLKKK
jgi:7SK snRNA methylphosphate capping enzyme